MRSGSSWNQYGKMNRLIKQTMCQPVNMMRKDRLRLRVHAPADIHDKGLDLSE